MSAESSQPPANSRTVHRTEHTLKVDASAGSLYALAADVRNWPAVFEPTVYVRHLAKSERTERFEIWAEVNGEVAHWTSRRVLDARRRYISFRQEHSSPPIASMSGGWFFRDLPGGGAEIVLRHRFTTTDDDPGTVAAVVSALDRNSHRELAALGRIAAMGADADELVFSFADTIELAVPVSDAYAFIARAERWAEVLPHVLHVDLTEPSPGVQELVMETATADGSRHSTRSTRICREDSWIAYKQQITPDLLAGHSGEWSFTEGASGAVAVARHTVVIDPAAVVGVLGHGASLADARAHLRDVLGRNSRATLEGAVAARI